MTAMISERTIASTRFIETPVCGWSLKLRADAAISDDSTRSATTSRAAFVHQSTAQRHTSDRIRTFQTLRAFRLQPRSIALPIGIVDSGCTGLLEHSP